MMSDAAFRILSIVSIAATIVCIAIHFACCGRKRRAAGPSGGAADMQRLGGLTRLAVIGTVLTGLVLAVTGLAPTVVFGERLEGYLLMCHVGCGGAFAVLLALTALAVLMIGALAALGLWPTPTNGDNGAGLSPLITSWEFGDAWNAVDNKTWTQQIIIVAQGGDGDYRYFANDNPIQKMFEVVLPLCDGARGTVEVQSGDGQSARIEYEFDSPFCQ